MKKGFTLVELLGVIIILSAIALLVLPPMLKAINGNKDKISAANKEMVYSAADLFISNNSASYPKYEGSTYCIPLSSLVQNGLLDSKVYDEDNGLESTTTIKVYTNGLTYTKSIVAGNECTESVIQPNIDFAIKTEGGQTYIVIDTYSSSLEIDSIKTASGEDVERRGQNLKIYVSGYTNGTNIDGNDYAGILQRNDYTNYTVEQTSYPTVEYLKNNNYNVFVDSRHVWGANTKLNDYFDAGINVISIGNDSTSALTLINTSTGIARDTHGTYTAVVNNNFTKRIGNLSSSTTDNRNAIKFVNGTQVLYSETINGTIYDAIGCYTKDNTKWIHSQLAIGTKLENYLIGSLEYISDRNLYYYKVNGHGTYNFTIYYKSGSSKQVSYTY